MSVEVRSRALRFRSLPWIVALILCVTTSIRPASAAADEDNPVDSGSPPMPTGYLRVSRPSIVWHFVLKAGRHITSVHMDIDGVKVPAVYDNERRGVVYTPPDVLVPRAYNVQCWVVIDGNYDLDARWTFTVTPQAVETLSPPSAGQSAVCQEINALRNGNHLPPLTIDPRLCAAANGHAAYMQNHGVAHEQVEGLPGFTGKDEEERVRSYGFETDCYEDICPGTKEGAIRMLFDAPYHRIGFLQPGQSPIGAGVASKAVAVLFGKSQTSDVVVSPYDGQQNVPLSWNGVEFPNPLQQHEYDDPPYTPNAPVGYPIMLCDFTPGDVVLTYESAELTTVDGHHVSFFRNTSDDDKNIPNAVLLIPRHPLEPGVTYRVSVRATDNEGRNCSRSWTFTTIAVAPLPRRADPHRPAIAPTRPHKKAAQPGVVILN